MRLVAIATAREQYGLRMWDDAQKMYKTIMSKNFHVSYLFNHTELSRCLYTNFMFAHHNTTVYIFKCRSLFPSIFIPMWCILQSELAVSKCFSSINTSLPSRAQPLFCLQFSNEECRVWRQFVQCHMNYLIPNSFLDSEK